MNKLPFQREVSARMILRTAEADAEFAERSGYTSLDYSGPICRAFSEAFVRLSLEERRYFVEKCCTRFTGLNRHTPPEYAAAAEFLIQAGKLRTMRGRVSGL